MRLSLKARLLICSLAAVIITALSLSLISNKTVTDDALNNAYIEVNRLGKTYSQSVTDWIADRQNALSALKYHLEKTPPADMVPALLQTHQAANFSLTYYGTADGKMYRQDPSLNRAGYDPRERPWYKSAINAGQLTTTAPYISATQQVMVVTMAEPVKENGQIIGVVGADLSLQQLVDEVINMDVPGNGYAILVSNDGSIVAHPQKEMWQKNINAISSVFTPDYIHQLDSTHALTTLMLGDDEKLIYATPIKKTDWSMIYIMDKDAILAHANNLILLQSAIALGILIVFSIFLVIFFRSQFKDLERVATALNDISEGEGDLTVRINTQHPHDEIGVLAAGFNRFTERLHAMVSRLSQISDELTNQSSAAFNIANSNNVAISTQQDEITMVATAVTEMASATQEIANHAEETAHTSQNAVSLCQQGQTQVQQSQNSIRDLAAEVASAGQIISELNQHAHAISSILATITGIAEQTNLLALNAAIEAARAGEQGRGFAVVADEVRVLSQRTHASTQEIQTMIETLQNTTNRAVSTMTTSHELANTSVHDADLASENLQSIGGAITKISDMASHIATAAEEQTSVTAEINTNTESIREVSAMLAQEAQHSATQAEHLATLTRQLQQEVGQFKL